MIREIVKMQVNKEHMEQIMATVRIVVGNMISDSGCRKCNLSIEIDDDLHLGITSEWRDQLSHHQYTRSDTFLALLLLLDMSVTDPEVKYEVVNEIHGLEYVSGQRDGSSPSPI